MDILTSLLLLFFGLFGVLLTVSSRSVEIPQVQQQGATAPVQQTQKLRGRDIQAQQAQQVKQPPGQQQQQEGFLQQQQPQGLFPQLQAVGAEIFRDDFNEPKMDTNKWVAADVASTVNSELEYYAPDDVYVEKGAMVIRAQKRNYKGRQYTSGRVDTNFTFMYGEVEIKARMPKGAGLWPAFWMARPKCAPGIPCPEFWPPAIIMVEMKNNQPTDTISTNIYLSDQGAQILSTTTKNGHDMTADFHIYKMSWTKKRLVWYIDGKEIRVVNETNQIAHQKMKLVINLAMLSEVEKGEPGSLPAYFLLDYVVVRQSDEQATAAFDEEKAGSGPGGVPKFVGPLVGTILGLLLISMAALYIFFRRRRYQRMIGNMRRDSEFSWNSDFPLYCKTGDPKYDGLMEKYCKMLQIPPDKLQISEKVLGKGEFGIVYKGKAEDLPGHPGITVVAVKTLHQIDDPEAQQQLAEEIRVMTKVGRHLNIVNLLGTVTKDRPFLLMEYCRLGSLLSYVKRHRGPYYYNQVDEDGSMSPFDPVALEVLEQNANRNNVRRDSYQEDQDVIATKDLISFAFQISRGMEYLVSRYIIHRDLAARNVLVTENRVVKISDFGMARQRQVVYVLENEQMALPVKWMPPEALLTKTFSQKSDVWSYGILLWETFSLGETPYMDSGVSGYVSDFISWLADGHHLERPIFCPTEVYEVMEDCWSLTAGDRPTFAELRQRLDAKVTKESSDTYLTLDAPYMKFNQHYQNMLESIAEAEAALPDSEEDGEGEEAEEGEEDDEEGRDEEEESENPTEDNVDEGVDLSEEEFEDVQEGEGGDESTEAQPAGNGTSTDSENSSEPDPETSSSDPSTDR